MRTTKEILQMVLERIEGKSGIDEGICQEIAFLYFEKKITRLDFEFSREYVMDNIPDYWIREYVKSPYGWPVGAFAPRVEWLKEHIAKL